MLRTDTGNFNRFLTSLGLLCLAAALLIPYFYFHDTDVLRITQEELQGLTQTGRSAIVARQHRSADLEVWILVLSAALIFGGVACLWFGGKRLRHAQTKEDEAIDRQAKRDDVEIQRLSTAEVEEKRDEQAREEVEEPQQVPPRRAADRPVHADPPPRPTLQESRTAIARIEEKIRRTMEEWVTQSFEFTSEVKLVAGTQQLRLDGLFKSRTPELPDVLLELKVNRQSRNLAMRIRQFADMALAQLVRYRALTGRQANTWMLIVVPSEEDDLSLEEKRLFEERLNSVLVAEGKGTILSERELQRLPSLFSKLFNQPK